MSANQAINEKLQGSVAAYLRYGEVVNYGHESVAPFFDPP